MIDGSAASSRNASPAAIASWSHVRHDPPQPGGAVRAGGVAVHRFLVTGAILLGLVGCVPSGRPDPTASISAYAPTTTHPLLGEFKLQTESVSTGCFTPELELLLARIAETFSTTPVVTSGFRAPRAKRQKAGKGSYHTRCMAADVQVPGVAPSKVFAAVKLLPGRGGVGIYCHTRSVHVDVGPKREWRRGCRRRR